MKLFDQFIYGKTHDVVEQAIEQMRTLLANFDSYITSQLVP
jgi:hypothetical protein